MSQKYSHNNTFPFSFSFLYCSFPLSCPLSPSASPQKVKAIHHPITKLLLIKRSEGVESTELYGLKHVSKTQSSGYRKSLSPCESVKSGESTAAAFLRGRWLILSPVQSSRRNTFEGFPFSFQAVLMAKAVSSTST